MHNTFIFAVIPDRLSLTNETTHYNFSAETHSFPFFYEGPTCHPDMKRAKDSPGILVNKMMCQCKLRVGVTQVFLIDVLSRIYETLVLFQSLEIE